MCLLLLGALSSIGSIIVVNLLLESLLFKLKFLLGCLVLLNNHALLLLVFNHILFFTVNPDGAGDLNGQDFPKN